MSNALKYDSSKRAEDKLKKKKRRRRKRKARIVSPAQTGEKWTFSRHLPRILSLPHCCQLNQLVKKEHTSKCALSSWKFQTSSCNQTGRDRGRESTCRLRAGKKIEFTHLFILSTNIYFLLCARHEGRSNKIFSWNIYTGGGRQRKTVGHKRKMKNKVR